MKTTNLHIVLLVLSALALGSIDASAQLPVRTRSVQIYSDNNVNYVGLLAPNGLTSNTIYTWPGAYPTAPSGFFLTSDNLGSMTWADLGSVFWRLTGNAEATPTSFLGPTSASVPLNLASANVLPGSIDMYIGPVVAANRRFTLSNTTLDIGTSLNPVATTVTGSLTATGTTTLASSASAGVILLDAVTPGTLLVNGTPGSENVRMVSLSTPSADALGAEGFVTADNTGDLRQRSVSDVRTLLGIGSGSYTPPAVASVHVIPTGPFNIVAGATVTVTVVGPVGPAVHAMVTNINAATDQITVVTSASIGSTYSLHWMVVNP